MRRHDWPERLFAYLRARERRVFEWGKCAHDCCSFANGWLIEAIDKDGLADIPDYASEAEAMAILEETPLEDLIDARLERRESPAMAQRGDLGMVRTDRGATVVIVLGAEVVAPDLRGLVRLPRTAMEIAWIV
jgi:hypothetical protein